MSENFQLRSKPPKATVLNRPLLLVIASIIFIVVMWALFSAFSQPKSNSETLSNDVNNNVPVSPVIQQLPKNYQDVTGIKKFLNQTDQNDSITNQTIKELQQKQMQLEAELQQMHNSSNNSTTDIDPTAAHSGLFFPDQAPTQKVLSKAAKQSSNNKAKTESKKDDTAYDLQNMQKQKLKFLNSPQDASKVYNQYQMIKPVSPYEVQAGTIIPATLLTAINTSLPGNVVAQVRQDIFDTVNGQFLLIPKGSKLLGKYDSQIAYGQNRVLIVYTRLLRPDGSSIQLHNFAGVDQWGESGYSANVDNHWGRILGAATISTMLSFGAGVAADRNTGSNPYYPGAQQNAVLGAANGAIQTGQAITNKAINVQPTLTVPAGFNFNIIVDKDMVLAPYQGERL